MNKINGLNILVGAAGLLCLPLPALAAGSSVAGDNFLWLAVILLLANIAGRLVERIHMPGVLGELLIGVLLGNAVLLGFDAFEAIKKDDIIAFVAELGVVILLFQIGLESSLKEMREVGVRALLVAIVGIVFPFVLGTFLVGPWLLPGQSFNAYLFLGATLTATSVGITGRVFKDMGRVQTPEARIVLGAAVIDDVLGLVILAVVTGIVREGAISAGGVALLVAEAFAFLVGAIVLGRLIAPRLSRALAAIDAGVPMKLALMLSTCLVLAWLSQRIGLATIVGAFAAGLVLERVFLERFDEPKIVQDLRPVISQSADPSLGHAQEALDRYAGHHHQRLLEPLGYFFVPVFFVYTGMQVNLASFLNLKTLAVALGITVAAIIGKWVSGLAAGSVNKSVVGWGMVPRGEVGLIFAMVGNQLGVVSADMFSAIVIMVIVTTIVSPLVLQCLISRL